MPTCVFKFTMALDGTSIVKAPTPTDALTE